MARGTDSNEKKAIQREATQKFIAAVKNGGTKNTLKRIEEDLGISSGTGSVWCNYRNGKRSWPIPALLIKIDQAQRCGYISEMMANQLKSELPLEYQNQSVSKHENEYSFNASQMFSMNITQTVELLGIQIEAFKNRAPYGVEELEQVHYTNTCLTLLKPIQTLIQSLTISKQSEELRLKEKFGLDNYIEIAPSTAPENASAWDVGYTPEWWMKPPPSPEEIAESIRQICTDEVAQMRDAFIAKYGREF